MIPPSSAASMSSASNPSTAIALNHPAMTDQHVSFPSNQQQQMTAIYQNQHPPSSHSSSQLEPVAFSASFAHSMDPTTATRICLLRKLRPVPNGGAPVQPRRRRRLPHQVPRRRRHRQRRRPKFRATTLHFLHRIIQCPVLPCLVLFMLHLPRTPRSSRKPTWPPLLRSRLRRNLPMALGRPRARNVLASRHLDRESMKKPNAR
ncbi:hypothetical protein BCR44DRAFT_1205828 [Catenaria anguillulae PL171]|uniref:Uncharacterized protein n=1 Tax=Catenaria anguillulae PL171 TaxID=765915 RepID=A0A1Y2HF94_9FUNG|nr:hypothetical protein BCR44DRAFT_1205828 [Catenaria anguillulae PL171]